MIIEELSPRDELAWDEFVPSHNEATFYHLIGWKKPVESIFGLKPIYLMAKEKGVTKGISPLFLIKNCFCGKKLISIPFATCGGAGRIDPF